MIFVHDVSRAAHESTGPRRSENRSFAQMADRLITQENLLDQRLAYLLGHGARLSRPVFAARLDQVAQQLPGLLRDAALLHRPVLAHHVQRDAVTLLKTWVASESVVIGVARSSLSLPGQTASPPALGPAQSSLTSAVAAWDYARYSLVREPGRELLVSAQSALAHLDLRATLANLANAPGLTLVRGVGISAVSVSPSPLPAPVGEILLPPASTIQLGVSVTNHAYCIQPVTISVSFTSPGGLTQRQVTHVNLGPDASFAFDPNPLRTSPTEHASLVVSLSGAPAAKGASLSRTYRVVLAPSGQG